MSKIILSIVAIYLPVLLLGQIPKKIMECNFPIDSLSRKVKATETHSDTYYYKGQPYTGCAAEDLPEEKGVFIIEVENGKLIRNIAYYANGQMEREFLFQNGQSHGKHRMFFPNGAPYIEEEYDKGKPIGTHRRWHNNAQLAREAIFVNGLKIQENIFDKQGLIIRP